MQLSVKYRISRENVALFFAWSIASILFLNLIWFVLRVSSPVIRSDDWYFLDVFLRKAFAGNLHFSDFFVKRGGTDHSQPLFKLILLLDWKFFDIDYVFEAAVGAVSAGLAAVVLYRVAIADKDLRSGTTYRVLAWICMCALLFSLNARGQIWTWSLVALENLTTLIILVFWVVAWDAVKKQRYSLLALATLLTGLTSDDSALMAALSAGVALLLMAICDRSQNRGAIYRCLGIIAVCMLVVRIGYTHVFVVHDAPLASISDGIKALPKRLQEDGAVNWLVMPLVNPVAYDNPFQTMFVHDWPVVRYILALALVFAHIVFWLRAFTGKFNRAVFVAVCFMALSYAWIAGIILGRVSLFGNDYLNQPRYILLYACHLIALLLMWAGAETKDTYESFKRSLLKWVVAASCIGLILLQIPISINTWRARPFEWAYQVEMARGLQQLAEDPDVLPAKCGPEMAICNQPAEKRRDLMHLLTSNRLNVFSPVVQRRHKYLPVLVIPRESQGEGEGKEASPHH